MRLTPRRGPLVGGQCRVALYEPHLGDGDGQFFGDQLDLSRLHSLTELAFSGVGSHDAVAADGDPGVELIGGCAGPFLRRCLQRSLRADQTASAEADNKDAGALEKIAARQITTLKSQDGST